MIKAALPGLIRYTGSFPVTDTKPARPGDELVCDAVVELGFPNRETMESAMSSPAFLGPEREESSARLMDLDRIQSIVVEEVEIPLGD